MLWRPPGTTHSRFAPAGPPLPRLAGGHVSISSLYGAGFTSWRPSDALTWPGAMSALAHRSAQAGQGSFGFLTVAA
eukprot:14611200-Alexandrium_andersonii.AAC.1